MKEKNEYVFKIEVVIEGGSAKIAEEKIKAKIQELSPIKCSCERQEIVSVEKKIFLASIPVVPVGIGMACLHLIKAPVVSEEKHISNRGISEFILEKINHMFPFPIPINISDLLIPDFSASDIQKPKRENICYSKFGVRRGYKRISLQRKIMQK